MANKDKLLDVAIFIMNTFATSQHLLLLDLKANEQSETATCFISSKPNHREFKWPLMSKNQIISYASDDQHSNKLVFRKVISFAFPNLEDFDVASIDVFKTTFKSKLEACNGNSFLFLFYLAHINKNLL